MAGLVPWRRVPPLPFELACLPFGLLRFLRLPVVSYAVPALVAVGHARFFHRRPRNPLVWLLRRLAVGRSLQSLEVMQPPSGGFLEAIPLTSFVVMGLASTGRVEHGVTRRGVGFLLDSVRADASWPIDTNLAVWNTTLAVGALASASGDVGALGCTDWLLGCQHREQHPFTQAAPGGWGWSDSAGTVPTPTTRPAPVGLGGADDLGRRCAAAADRGRRGGRRRLALGPAKRRRRLAHLLPRLGNAPLRSQRQRPHSPRPAGVHIWLPWLTDRPVAAAIERGLDYLAAQQKRDGSWSPLWFGNQNHTAEENPVYGTARVLLAYRDLGQIGSEPAQRGLRWLATHADSGGGWGGSLGGSAETAVGQSSVEETALAVQALLAASGDPAVRPVLDEGIQWLIQAVVQSRHRKALPIRAYFAKLWYYEKVFRWRSPWPPSARPSGNCPRRPCPRPPKNRPTESVPHPTKIWRSLGKTHLTMYGRIL